MQVYCIRKSRWKVETSLQRCSFGTSTYETIARARRTSRDTAASVGTRTRTHPRYTTRSATKPRLHGCLRGFLAGVS